MASTGMGIGAIEGLRFGHLTSIPEHNLYQIEVYAHSKNGDTFRTAPQNAEKPLMLI